MASRIAVPFCTMLKRKARYAFTPRREFSVRKRLRKYLVAAALMTVFTAPAFAVERFYLAYDGKRCEVFNRKVPDGMKVLGTYDSQHDAQKAMNKKDRCKKG
jgi:hypothetical protein